MCIEDQREAIKGKLEAVLLKKEAAKNIHQGSRRKTELVVDVEHCRLHFENLVYNHDSFLVRQLVACSFDLERFN